MSLAIWQHWFQSVFWLTTRHCFALTMRGVRWRMPRARSSSLTRLSLLFSDMARFRSPSFKSRLFSIFQVRLLRYTSFVNFQLCLRAPSGKFRSWRLGNPGGGRNGHGKKFSPSSAQMTDEWSDESHCPRMPNIFWEYSKLKAWTFVGLA